MYDPASTKLALACLQRRLKRSRVMGRPVTGGPEALKVDEIPHAVALVLRLRTLKVLAVGMSKSGVMTVVSNLSLLGEAAGIGRAFINGA